MLLFLGFPGLILVILGLCGLLEQQPLLERIHPIVLRIAGVYLTCLGVFLFAMMIWGLLTEPENRLGFTLFVPISAVVVLIGLNICNKATELIDRRRRDEFFKSKTPK